MPGEYTLEELAKMVRINPRTIRSYIQQGLLSGPDSMGRNARYKDYHLKRLRVIRTLKEVHHLPLSEIRRIVTMAGPEEDIQIQLVPLDGEMQVEAREVSEEEASAPSSALDYVRSRRASAKGRRAEETDALPAPPPIMSSPIDQGDSVTSPLEALLYKLRDQGTLDNVPRKTRGEEWVRLEVTPDIEIHVRGQLRREQLSDFEQLADLMRHILLGSEDDE
jgi:DNA-binding transcriptional MerR regulator